MVSLSSLTRQLFAAIGVAALLVNGAQQCHAWCLLTECSAKPGAEDSCCKKAAHNACGKRKTSAKTENRDLSHRQGCPNPEQCVCCQAPTPQQAPTPVDVQAVIECIAALSDFVGIAPQLPALADDLVFRDWGSSSRSFDVCVKLCRLVV